MTEEKKKEVKRGRILFFVILSLLGIALIPYEFVLGFVLNIIYPDFSLITLELQMRIFLWLLISLPAIYLTKNSKKTTLVFCSLIIVICLTIIILLPFDWLIVTWSYALRAIFCLTFFILATIQKLAPNNILFTKVKEANSKIIVKGGEFDKCLIQRRGYTFDYKKKHPDKWTVIEENEEEGKVEPRHLLGGIRFYGIWPLWDIWRYDLQWTTVKEEEEKSRKERLAYVPVYDDVYLAKVKRAEDVTRLPLDIDLYLRIMIVNPYKAVFGPQAWLEMVMNTTEPLIRRFVAQSSYNDLLREEQTIGGKVWQELEREGFLGEEGAFIQRYGVKVLSLQFRQIEPPEEYRKQTIAEILAELEAAAKVAEAGGEKIATILQAEAFKEKIALISNEFRGLPEGIRDLVMYTLVAEFTKGKDAPGMMILHKLAAGMTEKTEASEDLNKIVESLKEILESLATS